MKRKESAEQRQIKLKLSTLKALIDQGQALPDEVTEYLEAREEQRRITREELTPYFASEEFALKQGAAHDTGSAAFYRPYTPKGSNQLDKRNLSRRLDRLLEPKEDRDDSHGPLQDISCAHPLLLLPIRPKAIHQPGATARHPGERQQSPPEHRRQVWRADLRRRDSGHVRHATHGQITRPRPNPKRLL